MLSLLIVFTWGRRMSKKFELLRRSDNRKLYDAAKSSSLSSTDPTLTERTTFSLKRQSRSVLMSDENSSSSTPIISNNSFKTFFHRIGSTGMLSRSNQSNTKQPTDTRTLYRSSSTSQLNTSSYVKGEDPTDGINLCNRSKVSGTKTNQDTKNANDKMSTKKIPIKAASYDDIARVSNEPQTPTKRANFPYAFLRSKLSVLPEENGGSVINQKRALRNALSSENAATNAAYSPNELKVKPVIEKEQQGEAKTTSDCVAMQTVNNCNSSTNNNNHNNNINDHNEDNNSNHNASDLIASNDVANGERITAQTLAYQKFSSCFSSNESGYDSDSRQTEDQNVVNFNNSKDSPNYDMENGLQKSINNSMPQTSSKSSLLDCNVKRRRYKHIKLQRKTLTDQLGIVVSPQYSNFDSSIECRYIVSDILTSSLAHLDGKIRIGDEIVNVNRGNLRGMQSIEKVQDLLTTFIDNSVELVVSHDEFATSNKIRDCAVKSNNNVEKLGLDTVDFTKGDEFHSPPSDNINTQIMESNDNIHNGHASYIQSKTNNTLSGNKIIDMLPLQNFTEYIPVYGDRSKIPTTISDDEKWQILSKTRSEFLSKYGYLSPTMGTNLQSSGSASTMHCNEKEVSSLFDSSMSNLTKSNNRHSYCDYKPFLSMKNDNVKTKYSAPYSAPLEYRSIRFNRDLIRHSCDLSADLNGSIEKREEENSDGLHDEFEKLPLIGDSINALATISAKQNFHNSSSIESEKISIQPIDSDLNGIDEKTAESKSIEY